MASPVPALGVRSMKPSLLLVASLVILPLYGLSGTAMSKTATSSGGATNSLPSVVVEAPKQRAALPRPEPRAVARNTQSPRTSRTSWECIGGCVTSFRSGDRPWVGCSLSGGVPSSTCRNIGPGGVPYKTYSECMGGGISVGSRTNEVAWYCNSIALKDSDVPSQAPSARLIALLLPCWLEGLGDGSCRGEGGT